MTGYDLGIEDHGKIPAAIEKLSQAMTPGTADQCEAWLVMLQAATARRNDSEAGSAVAYSLYASELRQWPADVARAACERLARGKGLGGGANWFPTLAELVAECERQAAPRKVLLASLSRWAPEAERPTRPTGDDREAIHKMAAETIAALRANAEAKRRPADGLPSTAGKPDETGITPQMREVLARQRGESHTNPEGGSR